MAGQEDGAFYLISLPIAGKNAERTLQGLAGKTAGLSENNKFEVPPFKVGTLDSLMKESETLASNDMYCEVMTRKIASFLRSLLAQDDKGAVQDRLQEALQANGKTMRGYLQSFRWDGAKFNVNTSVTEIGKDVVSKVNEIDADLKKKMTAYTKVKSQFSQIERSNAGTLMTRDLNGVVQAEDCVLGSEYLITLAAVVPKTQYKDWEGTYETLTDGVVPRSSKLVEADDEYGLWTVTCFRKTAEEFKQKAREARFTVRDWEYDPAGKEAADKSAADVKADFTKKHKSLVRWCTTMFGEAFIAWIHTKALRLFVESVLRYGLPVNFLAIAIEPTPKNHKKVRSVLASEYASLDASGAAVQDGEMPMTLGGAPREYFPYVSVTCPVQSIKGAK